jgi:hypothetical protein
MKTYVLATTFLPTYLLTPLHVCRRKYEVGLSSFVRYTDVYCFGFRIARVQRK